MAYRKDWGQPQAGGQGFARTRKTFGRRVTIGTADNVTGNTVGAFLIPKGFVQTGIIVVATDMDSGTAMLFTIGDAGSANRTFASSNLGQTGGSSTTLASTALLYEYTADTEVIITIATQSATAVAGTIDVYYEGFVK